jgi:aspartate 4-decarboxylase
MDHDPVVTRELERSFETISPFEFKNKLISLATEHEQKSAEVLLNAGRGNPNWTAATPRDAFFTLGHFAVSETRRVWDMGDLAGKPKKTGAFARFASYSKANKEMPGMELLKDIIDYGVQVLKFEPDDWVYQLVDGIIGDNYPMPDRMLTHVEQIVRHYVVQEMYSVNPATVALDLFAVEGATAAMCYIFDSLLANDLLSIGSKIALMVPIFPRYVEIPYLERYGFDVVEIRATGTTADGTHTWQYPKSELDKLSDDGIKALFLVNPSNPPSVAMDSDSKHYLVDVIQRHNPDLMIISDDVYGTFVDNYRSLLADLPYNTIGVYSFSKYFGVTGWRLGVICVHPDNVFDHLIRTLPAQKTAELARRYSSISQDPQDIKFIDRVVADSREVALNHTAGLSTPQQVQMALFAGFALLDEDNRYKRQTKDICRHRQELLFAGLGLDLRKDPNDAAYYTEFDLFEWADHYYGQEFTRFLDEHYEPIDILFRLAENSGIVLLNGGGFHAPKWSIRISLANLEDKAYEEIGNVLHKTLEAYVAEWKEAKIQH